MALYTLQEICHPPFFFCQKGHRQSCPWSNFAFREVRQARARFTEKNPAFRIFERARRLLAKNRANAPRVATTSKQLCAFFRFHCAPKDKGLLRILFPRTAREPFVVDFSTKPVPRGTVNPPPCEVNKGEEFLSIQGKIWFGVMLLELRATRVLWASAAATVIWAVWLL